MTSFPRGSQWRRWDLHIHTPGTMKNDQFTGKNLEEKWDLFYKGINDYVGDGTNPLKAVAVVAITDYMSVDNYFRVIKENRLPSCIKLVLPNVEMRIQPFAEKAPVNIHFIFNPSIMENIVERFFAKLSISYASTVFNGTKAELQRLGRTMEPTLNDNSAYKTGIEMFVPSLEKVQEIFRNDAELRDNTIILASNSSGDGITGIMKHGETASQMQAIRQSLYHFVDAIFSANPKDIAFFSGKNPNVSEAEVFQQCGGLKPCVHGCDAHNNERIFEPNEQRYCWIKADPTFNGLKQILYEPIERVKISPTVPEDKPPYYVIDSIQFDDNDFQKEAIPFSSRLTCIIGGKSTGKSLLLHNLAFAIDSKQVVEKENISGIKARTVINSTVTWKDNEAGVQRKIVYIPQTYLNRLSDDRESTTEIDKMIRDVVLLNPNIEQSYSELGKRVTSQKKDTQRLILDLLAVHGKADELEAERLETGDPDAIKREAKNLSDEKDRLSKTANISADELVEYEEAIQQLRLTDAKVQTLNKDGQDLEKIASVVKVAFDIDGYSDTTKQALEPVLQKVQNAADETWESNKKLLLQKINNDYEKEKQRVSELQKTIDKLQPKVQESEALASVTKRIEGEREKLQAIEDINKRLEEMVQKERDSIKSLAAVKDSFVSSYSEFADTVNNETQKEKSELAFSVAINFKLQAFLNKVSSLFQTRSQEYKKLFVNNEFTEECYCAKTLERIVEYVLTGKLQLKSGVTKEQALRDVFDVWYTIKYNVVMDHDPIDAMSPGKKALVLLELLIDMAESKCPILIDQPEDDLDNRSIFDDLIPFIKRKKNARQIIIVTHNANVVLGADADEVIVANQKGNNSPNKECRFEYRTGAIEDDAPVYKQGSKVVEDGILNKQGIQQHICDVLEGGRRAFDLRKHKYHI